MMGPAGANSLWWTWQVSRELFFFGGGGREVQLVYSSKGMHHMATRCFKHKAPGANPINQCISRGPIKPMCSQHAGSERIAKSEVAGQQLKEAQAINRSLSALGDVVAALQAKSGHVPYRNSKLTQVAIWCLFLLFFVCGISTLCRPRAATLPYRSSKLTQVAIKVFLLICIC